MNSKLILGIDTSNYCTSVAVIDFFNNVIMSERIMLDVKKGNRGLRQSEAFFQHIKNLPVLIKKVMSGVDKEKIVAASVSTRPRNVAGSYMPVFLAGESIAKTISDVMGIDLISTDHQSGHIAAAKLGTDLQDKDNFLAFHFSGGTTECLLYDKGALEIIGGTKDISFGQLIDRVGVRLGYSFPAGKYLDEIMMKSFESNTIDTDDKRLKSKVGVNDSYFNLSGMETILYKMIDSGEKPEIVIMKMFDEIAGVIFKCMDMMSEKYGLGDFLLAGGVMESEYLKFKIKKRCEKLKYKCNFATKGLSGDNAVGVAYLGGQVLWQENRLPYRK